MAIPYNADELKAAIRKSLLDDKRIVALRLLTLNVQSTPVGNPSLWQNPKAAPKGYVGGHARRNWHTQNGSQFTAELPGIDDTGRQAISRGASIIARATFGVPVFLTWTVPYAERLNSGHSTQAGANFIEMNVLKAARLNNDEIKNIDDIESIEDGNI